MKTANEMREAARLVVETELKKKAEEVKKYAEEILMHEIEKAANEGKTHTDRLPRPRGMLVLDIREYLKEFGYTVQYADNGIIIYW